MKIYSGDLIEKAKNGEFDVIIHGCNCQNTMNSGIAKQIRQNFPEAYQADQKTVCADKTKLGTFSEVTVKINDHNLTIINAYTQYRYGKDRDHFEYDTFPQLLQSIKAKYGDKKIGLPLIGCGLAGGDKKRILKMIEDNFSDVNYKVLELNNSNNQELNPAFNYNHNKASNQPNYTFFFHLNSPFSNFHPSRFIYKEFTFISNEQFMMFSKAKVFKDEEIANQIISLNNQQIIKEFLDNKINREDIINNQELADQWNKLMIKIKSLGRKVKNYDEAIWNKKRISVVKFGARLKFSQNPDLKQLLLATINTRLVESSPYDKIWGIGLSEEKAKSIPESAWPGQNLLGKVLDEVKAEFKNDLNKNLNNKV